MAEGAQAFDDVAVRPEIHVAGRGERRLFAEIEERLAAIGELHRHEAAAADIAGRRVDDGERIADRDRGIDRVAAALQHVDADARRELVGRDHHAVLGRDGGGRGGPRLDRDRRPERQEAGDRKGNRPHVPHHETHLVLPGIVPREATPARRPGTSSSFRYLRGVFFPGVWIYLRGSPSTALRAVPIPRRGRRRRGSRIVSSPNGGGGPGEAWWRGLRDLFDQ